MEVLWSDMRVGVLSPLPSSVAAVDEVERFMARAASIFFGLRAVRREGAAGTG